MSESSFECYLVFRFARLIAYQSNSTVSSSFLRLLGVRHSAIAACNASDPDAGRQTLGPIEVDDICFNVTNDALTPE
jgi:hypothetical protein